MCISFLFLLAVISVAQTSPHFCPAAQLFSCKVKVKLL